MDFKVEMIVFANFVSLSCIKIISELCETRLTIMRGPYFQWSWSSLLLAHSPSYSIPATSTRQVLCLLCAFLALRGQELLCDFLDSNLTPTFVSVVSCTTSELPHRPIIFLNFLKVFYLARKRKKHKRQKVFLKYNKNSKLISWCSTKLGNAFPCKVNYLITRHWYS